MLDAVACIQTRVYKAIRAPCLQLLLPVVRLRLDVGSMQGVLVQLQLRELASSEHDIAEADGCLRVFPEKVRQEPAAKTPSLVNLWDLSMQPECIWKSHADTCSARGILPKYANQARPSWQCR